MITVTNEMRCGNVKYTSGDVKIEGEFKIDSSNKIRAIDQGAVSRADGSYLGSFNAYISGQEVKVNLNDLSADVAGASVTAITTVITELEKKYNV